MTPPAQPWRWLPALTALTALLASACEGPTQLLVVVDSDIPGLAGVRADASAPDVLDSATFDVETTGLPFSFGVDRGPAPTDELHLHLVGLGDGAQVERTVSTRFLTGRVLRLEIELEPACVGIEPSCEESGLTCVGGVCVSQPIDPSTLPEGAPDITPEFRDAGPPGDAGTPSDGGDDCVPSGPCEAPGNPCQTGQWHCDSDAPVCLITNVRTEGACGSGRTCTSEGSCGVR